MNLNQFTDDGYLELWYDCDLEPGNDDILHCPWAVIEDELNVATCGAPENIRFALRAVGKSDHEAAADVTAVIIRWHENYPEVVATELWVCLDTSPAPDSEFVLLWDSSSADPGTGIFR